MTMTRDEAFAQCPMGSYVEFYANQWLVIPLAPVSQPEFFTCRPAGEALRQSSIY
jgi:hypothetical protein